MQPTSPPKVQKSRRTFTPPVAEEAEEGAAADVLEEEKVVEMVMEESSKDAKDGSKSAYPWLEREDKLDLAGLLNVLDGVVDSPNRIVIMTTNHPEKLDPALIRPGRINKQVLLGYLQPAEALLMVQHYFGEVTAD